MKRSPRGEHESGTYLQLREPTLPAGRKGWVTVCLLCHRIRHESVRTVKEYDGMSWDSLEVGEVGRKWENDLGADLPDTLQIELGI